MGRGFWRALRAVAAAFFGVRARREHVEDAQHLSPLLVIAVGLGLALVFVLGLVLVVRWVAP